MGRRLKKGDWDCRFGLTVTGDASGSAEDDADDVDGVLDDSLLPPPVFEGRSKSSMSSSYEASVKQDEAFLSRHLRMLCRGRRSILLLRLTIL